MVNVFDVCVEIFSMRRRRHQTVIDVLGNIVITVGVARMEGDVERTTFIANGSKIRRDNWNHLHSAISSFLKIQNKNVL